MVQNLRSTISVSQHGIITGLACLNLSYFLWPKIETYSILSPHLQQTLFENLLDGEQEMVMNSVRSKLKIRLDGRRKFYYNSFSFLLKCAHVKQRCHQFSFLEEKGVTTESNEAKRASVRLFCLTEVRFSRNLKGLE